MSKRPPLTSDEIPDDVLDSLAVAQLVKGIAVPGTTGQILCPLEDCTGTVAYSCAASNGHVFLQCSCGKVKLIE